MNAINIQPFIYSFGLKENSNDSIQHYHSIKLYQYINALSAEKHVKCMILPTGNKIHNSSMIYEGRGMTILEGRVER